MLELEGAIAKGLADALRLPLEQCRPCGVVLDKLDGSVVRLDLANGVRGNLRVAGFRVLQRKFSQKYRSRLPNVPAFSSQRQRVRERDRQAGLLQRQKPANVERPIKSASVGRWRAAIEFTPERDGDKGTRT